MDGTFVKRGCPVENFDGGRNGDSVAQQGENKGRVDGGVFFVLIVDVFAVVGLECDLPSPSIPSPVTWDAH